MSNTVDTARAVAQAFTRIGTANGHALPSGADNASDPVLHEYFVASQLASAARKRHELAKKELLVWVDEHVDPIDFDKLAGLPVSVLEGGAVYTLQLKVKNSAERVDARKLVNELKIAGVDDSIISKALAKATTKAAPAKEWKVV